MAAKPKKPFLLRINPKVMTKIEMLAAQELRSANAQIEVMLTEALKKKGIRLDNDTENAGE